MIHLDTGQEEYYMKAWNRTFSVMAKAVDDALQNLRDAEQSVKDAELELDRRRGARDMARATLDTARDELFEAHPELAPPAQATTAPKAVRREKASGGFEPVEVDDEDDVPDFRERS